MGPVLQLVSVAVCSPALYLLVWMVRRALQSLLFVASPWTGASLWGALFKNHEFAIFLYLAGAMLSVKVSDMPVTTGIAFFLIAIFCR